MKLSHLIMVAAISTGSVQAAQTFDYSYTFDTGQVVTGTFTGTAAGDLISTLSNITASLNGVAFQNSGNLYSAGYVGSNANGSFSTNAVVSFDGLQSNFIFANSSQLSPQSTYFYVIPWVNSGATIGAQANTPAGIVDNYNGMYSAANWHVAAVPEPETCGMMMVGLGLLGFMANRKKSV